MENPADPLLVVGEPTPALNDIELDAVIKVGAAGGKLTRHQLGSAVLAALLRAQVLAAAGPRLIELTPRGVRVLADAAKAATRYA
jgi:hypothetical protein